MSESNLLTFDYNGLDHSEYAHNDLAALAMEEYLKAAEKLPGRYMIEEMLICLKLENAAAGLKKTLRDAIYGIRPRRGESASKHMATIQNYAREYSKKWEQWRPGIKPNNIELAFNKILPALKQLAANVARGNYLKVLFCLPNPYGAMMTKISIKTDQGEKLIARGTFKGSPIEASFYERIFLPDSNDIPRAVRIETQGYGGQGLVYVSAEIGGKSYVPVKAIPEGQVVNAGYILDDDCKYCFLGEPDADKAWQNRDIAAQISALEIKLEEKK